MMLAGSTLGSSHLCGSDAVAVISNDEANSAITTELNGVRVFPQMNTLDVQDTLGQPVTASFTLLNPEIVPVQGDRVRILFYSQLIFAGTIDRVQKSTSGLAVFYYRCECQDWSQILLRRMVRRNFMDLSVQNILDSLLRHELLGEPLTVGQMDGTDSLPIVDVKNARAFDVCRTIAGITGQTFYVDFDGAIQMRSVSVPAAPVVLDESVVEVEGTTSQGDRETYRNVQTMIVTGTPPDDEDANVVMVERSNEDQIAERQALEGGSGRYEALEEITHPLSNRADDLNVLGIGYANLRLATSGVFRQTVNLRVRRYGFRAGQIASVDLPTFGIHGTFVIQRVTIHEEDGIKLVHDVELTSSSIQQRAYESWIEIIQKGKIIVQGLFALVHDSVTFDTPGAHNWTVPPGVTVITVTVTGVSAGGGGGARLWQIAFGGSCVQMSQGAGGGRGGRGGKAVSSVNVAEGQEFNVFIGTRGLGGAGGRVGCNNTPAPAAGTMGTDTTVHRFGLSIAEAYSGTGGQPAYLSGLSAYPGAEGAPGSGGGSIVTVGGGQLGGVGGSGGSDPGTAGENGLHGKVTIEW